MQVNMDQPFDRDDPQHMWIALGYLRLASGRLAVGDLPCASGSDALRTLAAARFVRRELRALASQVEQSLWEICEAERKEAAAKGAKSEG